MEAMDNFYLFWFTVSSKYYLNEENPIAIQFEYFSIIKYLGLLNGNPARLDHGIQRNLNHRW